MRVSAYERGAIFALLNRMAFPGRVGGFLIDLDGTVIEGGELIPGAEEALRTLAEKKIPYRIVTNTTSKPRSAILARMKELGLELQPQQVITAPIIGRDYLRREGITRCFPLLKPALPRGPDDDRVRGELAASCAGGRCRR